MTRCARWGLGFEQTLPGAFTNAELVWSGFRGQAILASPSGKLMLVHSAVRYGWVDANTATRAAWHGILESTGNPRNWPDADGRHSQVR